MTFDRDKFGRALLEARMAGVKAQKAEKELKGRLKEEWTGTVRTSVDPFFTSSGLAYYDRQATANAPTQGEVIAKNIAEKFAEERQNGHILRSATREEINQALATALGIEVGEAKPQNPSPKVGADPLLDAVVEIVALSTTPRTPPVDPRPDLPVLAPLAPAALVKLDLKEIYSVGAGGALPPGARTFLHDLSVQLGDAIENSLSADLSFEKKFQETFAHDQSPLFQELSDLENGGLTKPAAWGGWPPELPDQKVVEAFLTADLLSDPKSKIKESYEDMADLQSIHGVEHAYRDPEELKNAIEAKIAAMPGPGIVPPLVTPLSSRQIAAVAAAIKAQGNIQTPLPPAVAASIAFAITSNEIPNRAPLTAAQAMDITNAALEVKPKPKHLSEKLRDGVVDSLTPAEMKRKKDDLIQRLADAKTVQVDLHTRAATLPVGPGGIIVAVQDQTELAIGMAIATIKARNAESPLVGPPDVVAQVQKEALKATVEVINTLQTSGINVTSEVATSIAESVALATYNAWKQAQNPAGGMFPFHDEAVRGASRKAASVLEEKIRSVASDAERLQIVFSPETRAEAAKEAEEFAAKRLSRAGALPLPPAPIGMALPPPDPDALYRPNIILDALANAIMPVAGTHYVPTAPVTWAAGIPALQNQAQEYVDQVEDQIEDAQKRELEFLRRRSSSLIADYNRTMQQKHIATVTEVGEDKGLTLRSDPTEVFEFEPDKEYDIADEEGHEWRFQTKSVQPPPGSPPGSPSSMEVSYVPVTTTDWSLQGIKAPWQRLKEDFQDLSATDGSEQKLGVMQAKAALSMFKSNTVIISHFSEADKEGVINLFKAAESMKPPKQIKFANKALEKKFEQSVKGWGLYGKVFKGSREQQLKQVKKWANQAKTGKDHKAESEAYRAHGYRR